MKCGQFHMHMHMHYYLQSCSHFYMPGSQDEHFQPSPCHNYFITSISVINVTTQLAVSIQEFTYIYVQKHIVLFSATSWQLKNTLYNWLAYTFNMLNGLTTVRTAILRILQSKIEKGDPRHKKGTQIPKKVP